MMAVIFFFTRPATPVRDDAVDARRLDLGHLRRDRASLMVIGRHRLKDLVAGVVAASTAVCGFFIRPAMVSRLSKPAADARSQATLAIG